MTGKGSKPFTRERAIGDRPRFATESPAPAAKKTKNGLTLDNSGDSLLKFPRMTGGRNAKKNSTCYGDSLLRGNPVQKLLMKDNR